MVAIAVARIEKFPGFLKIPVIVLISFVGFPADWSSIAVMCPLFLYSHRGNKKKQAFDIVFWSFIYAAVYFFFLDKVYGVLHMFTFLSIPVIALYNGERGGKKPVRYIEGADMEAIVSRYTYVFCGEAIRSSRLLCFAYPRLHSS